MVLLVFTTFIEQIGLIAGALVALGTLMGWVWKKILGPSIRETKDFVQRGREVWDEWPAVHRAVMGDEFHPSMEERQVHMERYLHEIEQNVNGHPDGIKARLDRIEEHVTQGESK